MALEENLPRNTFEEAFQRIRIRPHADHEHFLREYHAELKTLNVIQLNDDLENESICTREALALLITRRPIYRTVLVPSAQ